MHFPILEKENKMGYGLFKSKIIVILLIILSWSILFAVNSYGKSNRTYTDRNLTITEGDKIIKIETLTSRGDATLITIENNNTGKKKRILIDIGRDKNPKIENPEKKGEIIETGNVVNALIRKLNIENKVIGNEDKKLKKYNIDYMILTHNHDDHWSGLKNLNKKIHIEHIFYSKVYYGKKDFYKKEILPHKKNKIIEKSTAIGTVKGGEVLKKIISDMGMDFIIFPALTNEDKNFSGSNKESENDLYEKWHENDASMIAVLQTKENRIIFGGDLWRRAQHEILNYNNKYNLKNGKKTDKKNIIYTYKKGINSYYNGVKKYLENDKKHYVIYKASHHGTGAYRTDYALRESKKNIEKQNKVTFNTEYKFIKDIISPDDVVVTGFLGGRNPNAGEHRKLDNSEILDEYNPNFLSETKVPREIKTSYAFYWNNRRYWNENYLNVKGSNPIKIRYKFTNKQLVYYDNNKSLVYKSPISYND